MVRASAPLRTRTLTDPIAISMEAARSRHAALGARTGSTETTGTKNGASSAGSANCPSFAALIQFGPPAPANNPGHLGAPPHRLRVVINVDHI
jgi:hypothetical protein